MTSIKQHDQLTNATLYFTPPLIRVHILIQFSNYFYLVLLSHAQQPLNFDYSEKIIPNNVKV